MMLEGTLGETEEGFSEWGTPAQSDVGPGPCGPPQEDAGFSHVLGMVRRVMYSVLFESSLLLCLGR